MVVKTRCLSGRDPVVTSLGRSTVLRKVTMV